MISCKYIFNLLSLLFLLASCQKSDVNNPSPSDSTQNGSSGPGDLGMLYFLNGSAQYGDSMVQYDLDKEQEIGRFKNRDRGFGLMPFFGQTLSDSGRIYFSSCYSITCMDAKTSQVLWMQNLGSANRAPVYPYNFPLLVDSIVYSISYGGNLMALNAINKYSGKVIWRADLARNMDIPGRFYGTPIVYKDKIYAVCPRDSGRRQNIHCYNRFTGKLIWENIDFLDNLEGTQIVSKDGLLLVFSTGNAFVAGYNLETGEQAFYTKFDVPEGFGVFRHVLKGEIYALSGSGIMKIDLANKTGRKVSNQKSYWQWMFADDIYLLDGFTLTKKDPSTFTTKWSWKSPYSDTMSFMNSNVLRQPDGYYYECGFQPYYITDKYIYWTNAATRYNPDDNNQKNIQVLNSIFILNRETGALIKEVKFPQDGFRNTMNPSITIFSRNTLRPSQLYP